MTKALSVFSGGLDSMLAAEIIRAQGIDVQGLFFETPFFTASKAEESARAIDLPLKIIDITEKHLGMLQEPKYGYGENMNPCIDCHSLMFRIAGEMLKSEKADFIITGEVLGQRPMSQHKRALSLIDLESGISGYVLRPLSAKNLPITIPEEKGWVDRNRLMDFSGRSRKPQLALAKRFSIISFPSPAGGCLLTDKTFSLRLKDLISSDSKLNRRNIELLKLGRHFRINGRTKIIIGRNKEENNSLCFLAQEEGTMLTAISVPGPTTLIIGEKDPDIIKLAASMTLSYSDAMHGTFNEISIRKKGKSEVIQEICGNKEDYKGYMI